MTTNRMRVTLNRATNAWHITPPDGTPPLTLNRDTFNHARAMRIARYASIAYTARNTK